MTNFEDVGAFHAKFGLPHVGDTAPRQLDRDAIRFRVKFMIEELAEYCSASGMRSVSNLLRDVEKNVDCHSLISATDEEGALDALVDLCYVAMGTAHLAGLPFDEAWAEVQRANMAKERATSEGDARSTRHHPLDVVKPSGWVAPDHAPAIAAAKARFA